MEIEEASVPPLRDSPAPGPTLSPTEVRHREVHATPESQAPDLNGVGTAVADAKTERLTLTQLVALAKGVQFAEIAFDEGEDIGVENGLSDEDLFYTSDDDWFNRRKKRAAVVVDEWWHQVEVSREFRQELGKLYPSLLLQEHEQQQKKPQQNASPQTAMWNLLTYLLFSSPRTTRFAGRSKNSVLMPYELVAQLVGVKHNSRGFSARRWLQKFSDTVFGLEIKEYRYTQGKVTEVTVHLSAPLEHLLQEEDKRRAKEYFRLARAAAYKGGVSKSAVNKSTSDAESENQTVSGQIVPNQGLVVSAPSHAATNSSNSIPSNPSPTLAIVSLCRGEHVSEKQQKDRQKQQSAVHSRYQDLIPQSHPAYPLLALHKERSTGRKESLIWRKNLPALEKALDAIADESPLARRRDLARNVVASIGHRPEIFYSSAGRSPRLYTRGVNPLRLPREYRKIAYAGCHAFDLVACQLAIVSKLWDISVLHEALKAGVNIWDELSQDLQIGADYKPVLKTALYSIIFGGQKQNILKKMRFQLERGFGVTPQFAEDLSRRFFRHRFIYELRKGRLKQERLILKQKVVPDAYGHPHSLIHRMKSLQKTEPKRYELKEVNSKELQSDDELWRYRARRRRAIRSLMSYVVQSYEVAFMVALIPVLQKDKQIYLLALNHDEVIVEFGNRTKAARGTAQIIKTIQQQAIAWDIPVHIKHVHLENNF